ncbi:MAG: replicative DNA helicase [Elusimicrobiota bacterium]
MAKRKISGKVPPQNIEAERSVLGSILIDEDAVLTCIDILRPENFYRTAHRLIFKSVMRLFDRNEPVDIVTVSEDLAKNNELEKIGDSDYLTVLVNNVASPANVGYYAKIVRDKALLRELIRVSSRLSEESFQDSENAQNLLDKAEQQVFDIRQKNVRSGFQKMSNMVEDSIDTIEKIANQDEEVSGVSTGFKDLDKLVSGLHKGNLIIVAGRPAMGKTSFGLNIAQYIGIEKNIPVGIFSLEMAAYELLNRMLCSEAQVELSRVRDGFVGSNEWSSLTYAAGRIKESNIYVDDTPNITPIEMKARARRLKANHNDLGLIVIDYIQLISGLEGRYENRQQEMSQISRSLKILAKEIEVPVIAMSQLSRAPEKRSGDARPRLSDLRESGAIEQDADLVLFLYRPSYYKSEDEIMPEDENKAELIIGKQRNGPTGNIDLIFQKKITRFRNFTNKQKI